MDADDLTYPVLGVPSGGGLHIAATPVYLTTNTARGLKHGYYDNMRIVDSRSRWFRVRSARKAHGVGRFGGYNIFFNQLIRVALEIEDEQREANVDEVRAIVLKDFETWDGWQSRGDFDVLSRRVTTAQTVPELLGILAAMVK